MAGQPKIWRRKRGRTKITGMEEGLIPESFYKFGALFCGCPCNKSLRFGVCIRAPDFWNLARFRNLRKLKSLTEVSHGGLREC